MKTLSVTLAILFSSLFNGTYANIRSELDSKIQETVKFEKGIIPPNKNHIDFVRVSFRINPEGNLEILEVNYSDARLRDLLIDRLSEIRIEEKHDAEEVYYYKFSFELL